MWLFILTVSVRLMERYAGYVILVSWYRVLAWWGSSFCVHYCYRSGTESKTLNCINAQYFKLLFFFCFNGGGTLLLHVSRDQFFIEPYYYEILLWPSLSVITQRQSRVTESDNVAGKNNNGEHDLCVLWFTLLVKLPPPAHLQSFTFYHMIQAKLEWTPLQADCMSPKWRLLLMSMAQSKSCFCFSFFFFFGGGWFPPLK